MGGSLQVDLVQPGTTSPVLPPGVNWSLSLPAVPPTTSEVFVGSAASDTRKRAADRKDRCRTRRTADGDIGDRRGEVHGLGPWVAEVVPTESGSLPVPDWTVRLSEPAVPLSATVTGPSRAAELNDIGVRAITPVGGHATAGGGGDDERVVPRPPEHGRVAAGVRDGVVARSAADGQGAHSGVPDRLRDGTAPRHLRGRLGDEVVARGPVDEQGIRAASIDEVDRSGQATEIDRVAVGAALPRHDLSDSKR